jgi:hypothetical protein
MGVHPHRELPLWLQYIPCHKRQAIQVQLLTIWLLAAAAAVAKRAAAAAAVVE